MADDFSGFPIFRGLQKPMEFMGIRGRFLLIAAVTILGAAISFFALSALVGGGIAAGVSVGALAVGIIMIYTRQKEGLHSKKRFCGIVKYRNIWRNHL